MQDPDLVLLGYQAKVTISGTRCGVKSGTIRGVADRHDTSDTESGRKKRHKGGMRALEISIEAELDTSASPHSAPFTLLEGDLITLKIEQGDVGSSIGYYIPSFLVENFEASFRVGETQKFSFSGVSNGSYSWAPT